MHPNDIKQARLFAYWLNDHGFPCAALDVMTVISVWARHKAGRL